MSHFDLYQYHCINVLKTWSCEKNYQLVLKAESDRLLIAIVTIHNYVTVDLTIVDYMTLNCNTSTEMQVNFFPVFKYDDLVSLVIIMILLECMRDFVFLLFLI